MPTNHLTEVTALAKVKKPVHAPTSEDWLRLENEIGSSFPTDYKKLLSSLGKGHFGANLTFELPASKSFAGTLSHDSLIDQLDWFTGIIAELGTKFYPDKSGLVYIGHIDRQYFFFEPKGRKAEARLILIDSDYNKLSALDDPLTTFIYKLYHALYPQSFLPEQNLPDLRACIWHDGNKWNDDPCYGVSKMDRPFFTSASESVRGK